MYIKNLRALDAKLSELVDKYEAGSVGGVASIAALLPIEQGLRSMVHNRMLCDHTRHDAEARLNAVGSMIQGMQRDIQDDTQRSRITFDIAMVGWLLAVFIYLIAEVV